MRILRGHACSLLLLLFSSSTVVLAQPAPTSAIQAEIETVYTLPDGRVITNRGRLFRSRLGQVR